jgi:hypothetical protein
MPELQPATKEIGPEHWRWERNPESYTNPKAPLFTAPSCDIYPRCDLKLSSKSLEESGLLPGLKLT